MNAKDNIYDILKKLILKIPVTILLVVIATLNILSLVLNIVSIISYFIYKDIHPFTFVRAARVELFLLIALKFTWLRFRESHTVYYVNKNDKLSSPFKRYLHAFRFTHCIILRVSLS